MQLHGTTAVPIYGKKQPRKIEVIAQTVALQPNSI
jgi:hypothetical protein